MRVNGLLIRWSQGYSAEFDSQSEGDLGRVVWSLLDVPQVRSYDEVERIVAAEFDRYAQEQMAFSITVDPRNGPVPYDDYDIGDTVLVPNIQAGTTTVRVTGMTVTWDEEGNAFYAPEVGEQIDDEVTRIKRAVSRAMPGSLGGRSELAQPIIARRDVGVRSKRKDRTVAEFSNPGALTLVESGDHEFQHRELIVEIVAQAKVAGGSPSTFQFKHNGSNVSGGVITISAGATEATLTGVYREVDTGDKGSVICTADGGHERVVIQLLRSP